MKHQSFVFSILYAKRDGHVDVEMFLSIETLFRQVQLLLRSPTTQLDEQENVSLPHFCITQTFSKIWLNGKCTLTNEARIFSYGEANHLHRCNFGPYEDAYEGLPMSLC